MTALSSVEPPTAMAPGVRAGDKRSSRRVLPGFRLTLGYTVLYLSLIVLIPISALFFKTFTLTWEQFWVAVTSPRVLASYRLTFGASLIAALVNLVFALPTAVAGISLTALLAGNGWLGQYLEPLGIKLAFTPAGIVIALIYTSPSPQTRHDLVCRLL